ncbi:copper amine oxidase N-terminal domain-containing protein [Paenibacillus sp. WLX1005]|uniref:copper amine oxidase N-terminal domain-containing protein n=1 Tax=Paenibacillus sp. WLX1005 TaxID=3243766 RepID=UPI0039843890
MRKFLLASVICIVALSISGIFYPHHASAATPAYRLYVDQVQLDAKSVPVMQNGTMMVPLKTAFTALGYTTSIQSNVWSMKNNEGNYIVLTLTSKTAKVNGSKKALSTAPQKINGTAFISLKSLGQITGKVFGIDTIRYAVWLGEKPILNSFEHLWGIAPEQLKAVKDDHMFVDQSSNNSITIMQYMDTINDNPSTTYFIFYNDSLVRMIADVDVSQYNAADPYNVATMLGFYVGVKNEFSRNLGKFTKDQSFKEPQGNKQLTSLVYSMQYQSFQYQTEWKDGRTAAALQLLCDGASYSMRVTMTDTSADSTVLGVLDETL